MSDIITIGWTILFPGKSADSLIILIIILTILYIIHKKRRKYVATVEFLKDLDIRDFEGILRKHRLYITPNTLKSIPKLDEFVDRGGIKIKGIRGNESVNSLVLRGLDRENAESIILAKELNAKLYARNRKVEIIAWDNGVEVLDYVEKF